MVRARNTLHRRSLIGMHRLSLSADVRSSYRSSFEARWAKHTAVASSPWTSALLAGSATRRTPRGGDVRLSGHAAARADVLTNLESRVAVVTGTSSGLGVQFAKALDAAGARLVLASRRNEPDLALAETLHDAVAVCGALRRT